MPGSPDVGGAAQALAKFARLGVANSFKWLWH